MPSPASACPFYLRPAPFVDPWPFSTHVKKSPSVSSKVAFNQYQEYDPILNYGQTGYEAKFGQMDQPHSLLI